MQTRRREPATESPGQGAKAVAAYLAALPEDSRAALEKLRKDIRAAAPDATELIAWQMPAFKQGRLLVCYAAFKDHCSLFPMSVAVMHRYAADLKKYVMTKGSIHFTKDKPIPSSLVRKIVKSRLAEIEAKLASGRR